MINWFVRKGQRGIDRVEPTIVVPKPRIVQDERPKPRGLRVKPEHVANAMMTRRNDPLTPTSGPRGMDSIARTFQHAPLPAFIDAPGAGGLAMDSQTYVADPTYMAYGQWSENLQWLGFPYLAELAQRPEYRRISETIAKDMTRKWIKVQAAGEDDKSDKIKLLEAAMVKHKIQDKFRRAAELDGFFGRGHLYIDMGTTDDPAELKTPLILSRHKIGKNSVKAFNVVEPTWTYPGSYNSNDPLDPEFYLPRTWYVMSKEVHRSRLLVFISRELPDLLKPAYAFGGLSMSQMAKPYVDNWLRTRQSVSDLVSSFSVSGLKTNMQEILNEGGSEQQALRSALFNQWRSNAGMMMIDRDTEEFFNVTTPLGTLDHLQAQSQEQMASVSGIPLTILLGITPSGLNASSEGEIRTYEAWIHAMQEHLFRRNLNAVLQVLQLDLFGEIDPHIEFVFEQLHEINDSEQAGLAKTEADTDNVYVTMGALAPEEVRQKLANDPDSPYSGLDLSQPLPEPEQEGDPLAGPDLGDDPGDDPAGSGAPPSPKPPPPAQPSPAGGGQSQDKFPFAQDSWPRVTRRDVCGLSVAVETRRNTIRSGVSEDGRPWSVVMPADYGYIHRTTNNDGEQLDLFMGPQWRKAKSLPVYVISQRDLKTGGHDEDKVMVGFESLLQAQRCYDLAYPPGVGPLQRAGGIEQCSWAALEDWCAAGGGVGDLAQDAKDFDESKVERDSDGKSAKNASGA